MVQGKRINEYNRVFDRSTLDSMARPYFFDHYVSNAFSTLDLGVRLQPLGKAAELCSYYKRITKETIKTGTGQFKTSATTEVSFLNFKYAD
jgi:hypothetical protein